MDAEHERVIVTKSGTYTRRCVRIGPKASLVIELGGERVVIRATSRSRVSVEATENVRANVQPVDGITPQTLDPPA
jgi:hypothetical protein